MTLPEWKTQWSRLDQFTLRADADRAKVSAEWFAQLQHFHVDAVDHGITQLIGSAKDTFLPALGLLKDFIRQRLDKYERASGKCHTCHGSTWIDAAPFKSNGMIYENVVVRCPDCGIPAPQYSAPSNRSELTSREHAEWRMGDSPRDYMPEAQKAKPWKPGEREAHKAEVLAAFAKLRIKLFGKDVA